MTRSREGFGREVIGPIIGEFCLRLWSLGSMLERPDDAAMLFCARGGLRLMAAYERFLSRSGLTAPTKTAPLMVSRVVAIKPALVRVSQDGALPPSAAWTLSYEFANRTLRDVVRAISGRDVGGSRPGMDRFTPEGLAHLLAAPEGEDALQAITQQAMLFRRHLELTLQERRHAILVDTGLFGTTVQLLSDGMPGINFSCALIARANYRDARSAPGHYARTFGLGVEADSYSPLQRRSAILRYWHLIEATFEPDLPSVRAFTEQDGIAVSNLEVPGWRDRIAPAPGSVFAGVMAYLESLPQGDASRVAVDADRAWGQLYRTLVWPDAEHAALLNIETRGNDFGTDSTSAPRPWQGPLQALRGHALWREGEIARSKTPLRPILLAAIEAAYGARSVKRRLTARRRR